MRSTRSKNNVENDLKQLMAAAPKPAPSSTLVNAMKSIQAAAPVAPKKLAAPNIVKSGKEEEKK